MSDNSDSETTSYANDPRTSCKYGSKCYQQNPAHLAKFKHPPGKDTLEPQAKKRKLEKQSKDKKEQISSSSDEESSASDKEPCETNKEISDAEEKSSDEEPETAAPSRTKYSSSHSKFIKEHFLVEMPGDFYEFWTWCSEINAKNPRQALKGVGLLLVGPFDVLAGKFENVKKSAEEFLLHWRFYRDPPEFQTVLTGDAGYHIGYFRDEPNEPPVFLASNNSAKDGTFDKMGENIFAAVKQVIYIRQLTMNDIETAEFSIMCGLTTQGFGKAIYLEDVKKSGDPFKKMQVGKLLSSLAAKADKLKLDLAPTTKSMRKRQFKVVTATLNKLGLVVPYNRKTELGYRELSLPDKDVMKLLTKLENVDGEQKIAYMSKLQHVFTYANIAMDECDFGTGIKLGWDILYHGCDGFNNTISMFLVNACNLLKREPFAKIAEAHMKNRKKGFNLSILEL